MSKALQGSDPLWSAILKQFEECAFSPEVRECAVRMVREHEGEHGSQWSASQSTAAKIGYSGETLKNLATVAPDCLRGIAESVWFERYGRRI